MKDIDDKPEPIPSPQKKYDLGRDHCTASTQIPNIYEIHLHAGTMGGS